MLVDDFVTSFQFSLDESLKQLAETLLEQRLVTGTTYEVNQALVFIQVFVEATASFYPNIEKMILVKDLKEILNRTVCNNEIKTTKLIKFYYCCLCSVAYGSPEFPEKPESNVTNNKILPFFGKTYKAIFRRLQKCDKKAITFASTIYLSRYAAITVPESFIDQAGEDYKKKLQRIPEIKEYNEESIKLSVSCFPKKNLEYLFKQSVKCLSTSAVSEQNPLGQYGAIFKDCPKVEFKSPLGQTYSGIAPVPFFAYSFCNDMKLMGSVTHLPEPLKVRSITTQGAYEFLAGKPFQATISSSMKENTNLVFGREVSEQDINKLVSDSKLYYGDKPCVFLSADYSSATDNISPLLSEKVDNYMIDSLGLNFEVPSDKVVCRSLWATMVKIFDYLNQDYCGPSTTKNNWVRVSTWFFESIKISNLSKVTIKEIRSKMWSNRLISGDVDEDFVQTFGQMMGDIKSFPVLCAINLSLWMLTNNNEIHTIKEENEIPLLDIKQIRVRKQKAPCLINGDDFLAYCPMDIVEKFKNNVSNFDLTLSIGKTYVSETVAQINSTNFLLQKDGLVRKIKPLPLHAVFSLPKYMPVDQSINYAIENNSELFNRLVFFNKRRIKEVTNNGMVNLCLPKKLGGLGVNHPPKNVTARQLLIAKNNLRRSRGKLEITYKWLPFGKIWKRNEKKYEIMVYGNVPKGKGVITDEFGREHVLQTYSSSYEARLLQKDDWLACMSKQKFKNNRGVMKITNHFHEKFVTKSNKFLKQLQNSKDKRLPKLENLLSELTDKEEVIVKNTRRTYVKKENYISFGTSWCSFQGLDHHSSDSYEDTHEEKQEYTDYERYWDQAHLTELDSDVDEEELEHQKMLAESVYTVELLKYQKEEMDSVWDSEMTELIDNCYSCFDEQPKQKNYTNENRKEKN